MATSSITHDFVITGSNNVAKFITALEEANKDRSIKSDLPGRELTNPAEILTLISKQKEFYV